MFIGARKLASRVQPAPWLERLGVSLFRRYERGGAVREANDPIHILNADELRALRRIEHGAIARAALAGALSAGLTAAAEIAGSRALFVAVFLGTAAVELSFLYWDALRSVHRLARVAGLALFPRADQPSAVAGALARAALELPNPPGGLLGVDPYRGASRFVLIASSIAYKAKIGLTNLVVRVALGRLLGAALRVYLALVSVPVTAFWNAVICWRVLREARVRAMGPSVVKEALGGLLGPLTLSAEARIAIVRAIGSAVVSKRNMHPNLGAALEFVYAHAGAPEVDDVDDHGRLLAALRALGTEEQATVLRALRLALVLDGTLSRRDRVLWRQALAVCGAPSHDGGLPSLRRAFVTGKLHAI